MLFRDLRHAWRSIRSVPAVTTVVVLSLGIGIGVNTAVFSWLQAVVFDPIPGVSGGGRIDLIEARSETGTYPGSSWREYRDLAEAAPAFEHMMAFRMVPVNVGEADSADRAYGLLVSGNYFAGLGLKAARGRLIADADVSQPGGEPVAVISHDFWQSHFGGQASVIGQSVRVNDRPLTIIGVAPERFQGTVIALSFDVFLPATMAPVLFDGDRELDDRDLRGYSIIGALKPGATKAQAQADVSAAMQRLARDYPDSNRTMIGEVMPIWQSPRGPQRFMVSALSVLQGVLLLVLLTVCGNTANLVLARAAARRREVAVRLALGAGRLDIVRLTLAESLIIALAGSVVGVLIATWASGALRAVPITAMVPIKFQTGVDATTLSFAALLGCGCGLLFGIGPAITLSRIDPQAALRAGSQVTVRARLHDVLVGIEVALALVVLIVAGLFMKSFAETRTTDPGFTREGVMVAAYDLRSRGRSVDADASKQFASRVIERLETSPLVERAAIATQVPLDIHGLGSRMFTVEGHARADGAQDQATANTVTPGYFQTMGIAFVSGHDFAALTDAVAPKQAIVNEEFVRVYVPAGDPVGRRIEMAGTLFTIVGVVRNSLSNAFGEPPTAVVYSSYRDRPAPQGEIHVRARSGSEVALTPDIRRAVSAVSPGLPIYNARTLTDHVERNLVFRRIPARLFLVLGPLLLALAAIGISAVVGYTVSERRMEIGMRLALGGTRHRVVRQLAAGTMACIAIGAALGWAVTIVGVRLVMGDGVDPAVSLGTPAILVAVAAFACWRPANRAATVEPSVALRRE